MGVSRDKECRRISEYFRDNRCVVFTRVTADVGYPHVSPFNGEPLAFGVDGSVSPARRYFHIRPAMVLWLRVYEPHRENLCLPHAIFRRTTQNREHSGRPTMHEYPITVLCASSIHYEIKTTGKQILKSVLKECFPVASVMSEFVIQHYLSVASTSKRQVRMIWSQSTRRLLCSK